MKSNVIAFFSLALLLTGFVVSCKKDEKKINLNVKPVTDLFGPKDGLSLDLSQGSTTRFEWNPTTAEDGSLVLYEVLFDKKDGDFSSPVYATVSDGKGVQASLTLTNVQLDHIADLAGVPPLGETTLKWTVLATKGWNEVLSDQSFTLSLKRGIQLPNSLTLSGSGTEATDKPLDMRKISDGQFEIFTKLTSGDLQLEDENGAVYGLQKTDDGFMLVSGKSATGINSDEVVWLKVNFGNMKASEIQIKQMFFWYCNENKDQFELPYAGNGLWEKDNVKDFLTSADWTDREQRYKYRMLINDGTGDSYYWLNSFMGDAADQDGDYPSSLDYRAVDVNKNEGSQWDWGWKLDRNYFSSGSTMDFWISLNPDDKKYNQDYKLD